MCIFTRQFPNIVLQNKPKEFLCLGDEFDLQRGETKFWSTDTLALTLYHDKWKSADRKQYNSLNSGIQTHAVW